MKDTFILSVLIMFTTLHIGRCYNEYRSYKKANPKLGYKTLFLRNSIAELIVLIIGVSAILIFIFV